MQSPPSQRRAIIVLEQNTHVREIISDFLAEYQFSVICLDDGYVALDKARESPPVLIVTEVLTKRLDGLSLCRLLRRDPKTAGAKILVLSVFALEKRALEAGADAFLLKPVEKKSLITVVRSLIGEPEVEQV